LHEAGFDPIPVNGKKPNIKGWQTLAGCAREDVINWTREHRDHHNTGVLARRTPALDADIKIATAAAACATSSANTAPRWVWSCQTTAKPQGAGA
jgi:hypothetical protein